MSAEEPTEAERQRMARFQAAREELAGVEERAQVLRATIDAIQRNCSHRFTREIYCTGKPEGSVCRICGKVWD